MSVTIFRIQIAPFHPLTPFPLPDYYQWCEILIIQHVIRSMEEACEWPPA